MWWFKHGYHFFAVYFFGQIWSNVYSGINLGLVRVYDIDYATKTFTWGSWVIREDNRPKYAAIESALLSFTFAFNELNLSIAKIDVKSANSRADNFYQRFGMSYQYQEADSKYYQLTKTNYIQLKYNQYYKFLLN